MIKNGKHTAPLIQLLTFSKKTINRGLEEETEVKTKQNHIDTAGSRRNRGKERG